MNDPQLPNPRDKRPVRRQLTPRQINEQRERLMRALLAILQIWVFGIALLLLIWVTYAYHNCR